MTKKNKIAGIYLSLLFFGACANQAGTDSIVIGSAGKSIDGSYASCTDNGDGTSMKIHLTFSVEGTKLDEDIYSYANNNCGGTGTLALNISATTIWGLMHQSTKLAGATDLQLTPSTDIFGCGAGQPGYILIVMSPDFSHFTPSQGSPACNASAVSTTLSPNSFSRE